MAERANVIPVCPAAGHSRVEVPQLLCAVDKWDVGGFELGFRGNSQAFEISKRLKSVSPVSQSVSQSAQSAQPLALTDCVLTLLSTWSGAEKATFGSLTTLTHSNTHTLR